MINRKLLGSVLGAFALSAVAPAIALADDAPAPKADSTMKAEKPAKKSKKKTKGADAEKKGGDKSCGAGDKSCSGAK